MKLIHEDLLTEVRKEDDLYYQGAFWIEGNSVRDIKKGNFKLLGKKYLCDYEGKYLKPIKSKNSLTHKQLWHEFNTNYPDKSYTYLPRGRVDIYKGIAYINLPGLFNQPDIIDAITKMYNLNKLELEIAYTDSEGGHYDFGLD